MSYLKPHNCAQTKDYQRNDYLYYIERHKTLKKQQNKNANMNDK